MTEASGGRRPVITEPIRIMTVVGMVQRRVEIVRWLDDKCGLAVVATHSGAAGAITDLNRSMPDMVVVDPETAVEGFAELAMLSVRQPGLPILILRLDGSVGAAIERFGCRNDDLADEMSLRFLETIGELAGASRLAEEPSVTLARPAETGRPFH